MYKRLALLAGSAILGSLVLLPTAALAHEQRDVGTYHLVVGFLNEPAIQDQMNSLDLTITTAADKKPVEGAEKTLKAEVIVGGNAKSMPLTLRSRFGLPGKYAAYFIPTATGSYQFHLSGTINGDPIDQKFESGPNTFNDVDPVAPLQFPDKLGDPGSLQTQLTAAQTAASSARTLGIAGIAVGLVGIAIGIAGWSRKPGAEPAGSPASSSGRA